MNIKIKLLVYYVFRQNICNPRPEEKSCNYIGSCTFLTYLLVFKVVRNSFLIFNTERITESFDSFVTISNTEFMNDTAV